MTTQATMQDDAKPGSRKLWCDLIDSAIRLSLKRGEVLDAERLLDSCGIFHWSMYRQQARAYAQQLIDAHAKAATKGATR
jgi:hypothetical protein